MAGVVIPARRPRGVSLISWIVQMLERSSAEAALASCRKRCFAVWSRVRPGGRSLIATDRSSRGSWAWKTTPMPPLPSWDTIAYGPSWLPGTRLTGEAIIRPNLSEVAGERRHSVGNEMTGTTSGLSRVKLAAGLGQGFASVSGADHQAEVLTGESVRTRRSGLLGRNWPRQLQP